MVKTSGPQRNAGGSTSVFAATISSEMRGAQHGTRQLGVIVLLVVAFAVFVLPAQASAMSKSWAGPDAGGAFNLATNWNPAGIPAPGDTVFIGSPSGAPSRIVSLTGTARSIDSFNVASRAILVVDGAALTLTGTTASAAADGGQGFQVVGGGTLALQGTGGFFAGATLGRSSDSSTGTIDVTGAGVYLGNGSITEAGPGLGTFRVEPAAGVVNSSATIQTRIDNRGTISASFMFLEPAAGSPVNDGTFDAPTNATLVIQPQSGTTFTAGSGAHFTGAGALYVQGGATLKVDAGGSGSVGTLAIIGDVLDLDANWTIGVLQNNDNGSGGRFGAGTLTVTADSTIAGGRFGGTGSTIFNAKLTLVRPGSTQPVTVTGGGVLRTNGTVDWQSGGVSLGGPGSSGTWQNAGAISVTTGSGFDRGTAALNDAGNGVLDNLASGTITKSTTDPFGGIGTIDNQGTITVGAGTFEGGGTFGQAFGSLTQTAGLTTVASGATLAMDVALQGGTVKGDGTAQSIANTGGTVAPGASPGTLTIAGAYRQGAGGTLQEEITGTTPGSQFDVLAVGGPVALDGVLAIVNDPAFSPALTDTFRILTAGSRTGQWASVTGGTVGPHTYLPSYQPDGATLCVVSAGTASCSSGPPPPRSTSTSVSCAPGSVAVGQASTCTATVSDAGSSAITTPTGTVSFSSDSPGSFSSGGSCTVAATSTAGVASCAVDYVSSAQGSGTHTITAGYGGDSTHAASGGTASLTVTTAGGGGGGGGSGGGGGGSSGGGSGSGAPVPVNVLPPSISGSPIPGKDLSCSTGTWTHSPIAFSYRWQRRGSPIAGAQASSYTVQILDEAQLLTCTVTASNAAGAGAPATSPGVLVAVPGTLHCPKPSGRLRTSQLGSLALGMTRRHARHVLHRFAVTRNLFDNFCLYAGWGIRVGYPSPKLLATIPARRRSGVTGKIVLALTANPYYALDGITPGVPVAAARGKLKLGRPFHIGLNYWYIASASKANGVLKVRHGIIQEVGLANRELTHGRDAQKRFLTSFNDG